VSCELALELLDRRLDLFDDRTQVGDLRMSRLSIGLGGIVIVAAGPTG
jgi:hypothetical protein